MPTNPVLMIPGTYTVALNIPDYAGGYQTYYHYFTVGCQSDYFPTANISGESGLIAGNNIVTSQQFYNTSRVKYVAGNQIILNPGFVAHEGSDVFLYNEPCVVPPRLSDEDSESPDQEMEKLLIAPNPARDFITVKIKDYNSKATFKIYNSTLQLVKVLNVENAAGQIISLAEFENGIYFIDAQTNEWSYKSKFVVNK
ncbi:MAG: T9SS type A sorting domain-containing protein [Bacteroidetes bacterium]|nr:T9SS type A sorting domain-containing protein [Bacteroidota bacterium]